jgi:hypothetical protein
MLMLLLACFNFSLLQSHLRTLQSFEQLGILQINDLIQGIPKNSPLEVFETLISQGLKFEARLIVSSKSQWFSS